MDRIACVSNIPIQLWQRGFCGIIVAGVIAVHILVREKRPAVLDIG